MRKIIVVMALLAFMASPACSQEKHPSGAFILEKIDENLFAKTRIITSRMVIHDLNQSRTVESKSWTKGEYTAFTEYLAPPREKGTKMLKLEDRLWIYSPSTDRVIQISGHMLRQSVMGSDLSYEDMMENPKLLDSYEAEVTGTDTMDGRPCWVLTLTATRKKVAYYSRKIWVDTERYVPLREEMFAKSGTMLKEVELTDYEFADNRWFPKRMLYRDVLKTGKGTEFFTESIEYDAEIPEHVFSKAALRR